MKSSSLLRVLVLLASSLPASAWSAGEITLGLPTYQGEGCPSGSAAATLSPDNTTLSILFDRFIAEAGRTTSVRTGRAVCRMQIPVQIAAGYRAVITRVDYRGFLALPLRGYAQLTVDYGFSGKKSPRFTRRFVGPSDTDFLATQILHLRDYQWTTCVPRVQTLPLDILAGFVVATNERNDQTIAAIDSQDLTSGEMEYDIKVERCR